MNYWEGYMSWPLKEGWICETCGNRDLEWGLINGQCRCTYCHTEYMMREDTTILDIPKSLLKEEYKIPLKKIWEKYQVEVDRVTDEQYDEFMPVIGGQII
jgi:predicted ATP-dependent serine protease